MSTPTPLLSTLNGDAGNVAQFEMLQEAISFLVRVQMSQVRVMGAGEVIVHPGGGGSETTLITTHD